MTTEFAAATGARSPRWLESRRPMGLGLMVPISERAHFGGTPAFADMVAMTRLAADVGFDVAWFADHFQFGRPPDEDVRGVWECWTMMAGVAATSERIGIGPLVACAGFRNPALVTKMAEAIDEISGGRFVLGLGAGWHEPEYAAFGLPFDHRVGRFEDAIAIIHAMLRDGQADHEGRFFQASGAIARPHGPRPDGIPLLVGTDGPRMLRLTARYADAWNTVWHKEPAAIEPLLAAVDDACRDVGRDPATLLRTAGGNFAMAGYLGVRPNPIEGGTDEMAEALVGFRRLGLRHFVCGLDPCTPATIEAFARAIEAFDTAD